MILGRLFEGDRRREQRPRHDLQHPAVRPLPRWPQSSAFPAVHRASRDAFLETLSLDSERDYRLGRIRGREIYITPLGPDAGRKAPGTGAAHRHAEGGVSAHVEVVLGRLCRASGQGRRPLHFRRTLRGRLAWRTISPSPTFPNDLIAQIPVLTPEMKNPAKRFIRGSIRSMTCTSGWWDRLPSRCWIFIPRSARSGIRAHRLTVQKVSSVAGGRTKSPKLDVLGRF